MTSGSAKLYRDVAFLFPTERILSFHAPGSNPFELETPNFEVIQVIQF